MQPTTDSEGRKRFLIGPVEMWVIGLIPAVLGHMLVDNWRTANLTISEQGKAIVGLTSSIAGMNKELHIMNSQLAKVPERVTSLEARMDSVERDVQELRRKQ